MDCPHCGTTNTANSRHCDACGAPLYEDEASVSSDMTTVSPLRSATLVGVGDHDGDVYEIEGRTVIGRLDTCDIFLDDKSVSREHARLSRLRNGYLIEDLGSTNGTLVNGRKINDAVLLRSQDLVTIGSVEFRFMTSRQFKGEEVDRMSENIEADPGAVGDASVEQTSSSFEEDQAHESAVASALPEVGMTFTAPPGAGEDESNEDGPAQRGKAVDEVRPVLHRLHDLALKHATQLDALRDERRRLREQIRELSDVRAAHESMRSALGSLPQPTISDSQLQELSELLEGLAAQPRDIEVLVKLGQQGAALALLVQEYAEAKRRISSFSNGSGPEQETGPI